MQESKGKLREDPFSLLGLPRRFRIQTADLEKAHLEASRIWHPDRFVLRPEAERLKAEDHMATLNEAYEVLKCPIARAAALLEVEGFKLDEGTDTASSPDFLMAMMELKEEASEARSQGNPEAIQEIVQKLHTLQEREEKSVFQLFDQLAMAPNTRSEKLEKIRGHLQKASYFRKTCDDLLIPSTLH
ncbi:MAG: Fe-S protein assembly co-chaperone HscB [Planctomycetota bacterium]|jgi:molecular chaperone HscB|nr:Fe-S protein assembly co-chaperone HscB [Planctomycetota bacterium]MDP6942336.1 Fe-S protein assembly co-chaperone HscB [Planctomycetota bacterium]